MRYLLAKLVISLAFISGGVSMLPHELAAQSTGKNVTPGNGDQLNDGERRINQRRVRGTSQQRQVKRDPSSLDQQQRRSRRGAPPQARQQQEAEEIEPTVDNTSTNLSVSAIGGIVNAGLGFGAEMTVPISPKVEISLRSIYSFADVTAGDGEGEGEGEGEPQALLREHAEYSVLELGVQSRVFLTRRFYLSGGGAYARVAGNYGFKLPDNSALTRGFTSNAYLAHVGLGNRWTFDSGFSVSVTWLELIGLLGTDSKAKSESSSQQGSQHSLSLEPANSNDDFEASIDKLLRKRLQLNLFVIGVGYSF